MTLDSFFTFVGIVGATLIALYEIKNFCGAWQHTFSHPEDLRVFNGERWARVKLGKAPYNIPLSRGMMLRNRYLNRSVLFHSIFVKLSLNPWNTGKMAWNNLPYYAVAAVEIAVIKLCGRPLSIAFGAAMFTVLVTFFSYSVRKWTMFLNTQRAKDKVKEEFIAANYRAVF